MAEKTEFLQAIDDAILDADSLERFINGSDSETVLTRLSAEYPTIRKALKELFESGGIAGRFKTLTALQASSLADGKYAIVTDDTANNGMYVKTAGAWVKSAYDPLAQAKAYTDAQKADTFSKVVNAFNTVALMKASTLPDGAFAKVINDAQQTNNGDYQKVSGAWVKGSYDPLGEAIAYSDKLAKEHLKQFKSKDALIGSGLPEGTVAMVSGDANTVDNGLYSKGRTSWVKADYDPLKVIGINDVNLNTLTESGVYVRGQSNWSTEANNYPPGFDGTGGVITVTKFSSAHTRQDITGLGGTAHRKGFYDTNINQWTWGEWTGVKYAKDTYIDIGSFLKNGDASFIGMTKSNFAQIAGSTKYPNGHIDNIYKSGIYLSYSSALSRPDYGFPFGDSSGVLEVYAHSSIYSQNWTTSLGTAFRWGLKDTTVTDSFAVAWRPWTGFSVETAAIENILPLGRVLESKKENLMSFGSSTLWYISDYLGKIAKKYNLNYYSYARSGDTIDGAGLAIGANKYYAKVPSGVILAGARTEISLRTDFSLRLVHERGGMLSNGVKCKLGISYGPHIVASNLTEDMVVDPEMEFEFVLDGWYDRVKNNDGIYIINSGKNNITSNSAQDILDATIAMIDKLGAGAKYLVGGHFINTSYPSEDAEKIYYINKGLKDRYGVRYLDFIDVLMSDWVWDKVNTINREVFKGGGITKTEEDIDAIARGALPPSLARNGGHLSPEMDIVMADVIEAKLLQLGYISK